MTNLTETSNFDTGIYQFETTDLIQGGPGGTDNVPHQALTNRTRWLYDNTLKITGDQTKVGKLTLSPTAGDSLFISTQSGVNAAIRMQQLTQGYASIQVVTGGALTFGVDSSGGNTERARIDASGNVSIGGVTPSQMFHLQKAAGSNIFAFATNGTQGLLLGINSSNLPLVGTNSSDPLAIYTNNTEVARFNVGGALDLSGQSTLPNNVSYSIKNSGGTATSVMTLNGANQIQFGNGGTVTSIAWATGGATRMTLDSSGNIGIGQVTPGAKLDVNGAILAEQSDANVSGLMGASTISDYFVADSTKKIQNCNLTWKNFSDASAGASAALSGYAGIRFYTQSAERMRIDFSGNVGIGVAPGEILDVQRNTGSDIAARVKNTGSGRAVLKLDAGTGSSQDIRFYENAVLRWSISSATGTNVLSFVDATNGTRMTLDASGNLGIGTTTPGAKLDVNGGGNFSGALAVAGAISGVGFSNYLASPPAIGGTAPSTGKFTTLTVTSGATVTGASTFTGAVSTPTNAIGTTSGTVTVNCALSNVHSMTLNGALTLALSNPSDGQTVNIFITQDSTGTRVATWPSSVKWPGGSAQPLSTAANSVDLLVLTYRSATGFHYATLLKGFA